tara:strand:+ start:2475 stop:2798 length:324 start_codon:yes stop_codon:yes gene_type:complete
MAGGIGRIIEQTKLKNEYKEMKHFIYTYERKRNDVNGNPKHWVTVWRVKQNVPIYLDRAACGYRGESATVLSVIQEAKELPKLKNGQSLWQLKDKGIANIIQLEASA